ncbi:DNA-3-methyladenine glycosylase [Legionella impletisoli]|uniref:Putative 3-methyladenine DNA glycosylase n=1 Tax=Legionella impletisoli TaxID=343510 RepID=A0A917NAB6_9GAMM|nr:DNA-3-methyladenine glycosylase [Legionella impletisoli]GGI77460.1 putative 3-methyladenine DNA glycosylase [Legionella impletisoli]
MKKLSRDFYKRDTQIVAKELLGTYLIRKINDVEYIGRIVEVEAYLGEHDLAAHSSKGITKRTKIMFGPPGFAYVYMIYGLHYCFNVVTEEEGQGAAVLIRALEPVKNLTQNTRGPALLCKAMSINKTLNGHDLLSTDFYIAKPLEEPNFSIIAKPRIGVHYAKEWADCPLRFYIKDNLYISKS